MMKERAEINIDLKAKQKVEIEHKAKNCGRIKESTEKG